MDQDREPILKDVEEAPATPYIIPIVGFILLVVVALMYAYHRSKGAA